MAEDSGGGVNDTGQQTIIDPEAGDVNMVEAKPGAGEGEPADWEGRYKALQSQKDKEVAAIQEEANRLKALVSPFQKNIVQKDDGSLGWDFSDVAAKPGAAAGGVVAPPKAPEEPSEQDWLDNPAEAAKKYFDFRQFQQRQIDEADARRQAFLDAEESYAKKRNEDWELLLKEYPDLQNKESDLYKKADQFIKDNPGLEATPICNRFAVERVAAESGIQPQKVEAASQSPGKKDTSYIIGGAGASGGGPKPGIGKKKLTEEEFDNLTPEQQAAYMRSTVSL